MRMAPPTAAASLLEQFHKPHAQERAVRLETVPGNVAIDWPGQLKLASTTVIVAAASGDTQAAPTDGVDGVDGDDEARKGTGPSVGIRIHRIG